MSLTSLLFKPNMLKSASFVARSTLCKNISTSTARWSAYDADGKTTATVLNQEIGSNIMIDSYTINGFRLNNGVYIYGPVAVFPKSVLGWNVKDDFDISQESLTLFTLLEPKLDILVIGYGGTKFDRSKLDRELLLVRKKLNMNIELLPTERAIATYNFLASESRWVGAALIPPKVVDLTDADYGVTRKKPDHEPQPDSPRDYKRE